MLFCFGENGARNVNLRSQPLYGLLCKGYGSHARTHAHTHVHMRAYMFNKRQIAMHCQADLMGINSSCIVTNSECTRIRLSPSIGKYVLTHPAQNEEMIHVVVMFQKKRIIMRFVASGSLIQYTKHMKEMNLSKSF